MRRIVFLFVLFASAAAGFVAKAALENEDIAQALRDYGVWIAVFAIGALITLGLGLALGYLLVRYRLRRLLNASGSMTEADIAEGLVDMLTTPEGVTNPTPEDRQRAAVVNAGTWFMRRQATQFYFNATVTIMGGLIGTATLFLLYEQNKKFDLQNKKITLQTDAGITQSVLLEGTRRASLAGEITRLISDIREDVILADQPCDSVTYFTCFDTDNVTANQVYNLSSDLLARVQAFAQNNTPYQVAIFDNSAIDFDVPLRSQITLKNLSPERGQLVHALVQNGVSMDRLDLSFAQLSKAQFPQASLQFARLSNADLAGINLSGANLIGASLNGADLTNASLGGAVAPMAQFRKANLSGADLVNADLDSADLTDALIDGAHLSGTKFRNARMRGAIAVNAWAWDDRQPSDLPDNITVVLCNYDSNNGGFRNRAVRPSNC